MPLIAFSEFDKYQLTLNNTTKKFPPITRPKTGPLTWEFKDFLEPGRTYTLLVKSVSGKVTSWPMTAEITLSKQTSATPIHRLHCNV